MTFVSSPIIQTQPHFLLLAPSGAETPRCFPRAFVDQSRYSSLLAEMQRLRGAIYVKDGAIDPKQLSADGRHETTADRDSWHLLLLDANGGMRGCMRYQQYEHPFSFSQLAISKSTLAQCDRWGQTLRKAVDSLWERARRERVGFGEAGGWAVADNLRRSRWPVGMVLAIYGLARILGNALVVSTATMRNCSATILRRIGGRALPVGETETPRYYDVHYQCEMEILLFDSRRPLPKYSGWVNEFQEHLLGVPVISCPPVGPPPAFFPVAEQAGCLDYA
ncbi:MAG: hypothetical protein HYS04_17040 [Acidobacteria bacterium]|nr:hypothetical protein [Acidobacteriota bacterium]